MELIDPGPSRKGWHRLQNALRCPRLHALSTRDREGPRTSAPRAPLMKGTLLHTALAHHYALRRGDTNVYDPIEAVEQVILKQPMDQRDAWREHQNLINQTYEAYSLHWEGEQVEVKDIERELCASILDEEANESYLYTQRVDLVVRLPHTGKWWFIDHKTTSRLTTSTLRRYTLSGQFLGYQMLGKGILGDKWGGVMLNMIQWPKRNGSPEFQRVAVEAAPKALSTFRKTLVHAERTIRAHKHIEDPMEWPGAHHEFACWTVYGSCDYHDTCQWG